MKIGRVDSLWSADRSEDSLYGAPEEGFWHFCGGPKRLLADNDSCLDLDTRPGHLCWNPHFLEMCGHYSIHPIAQRVEEPRAVNEDFGLRAVVRPGPSTD